MSPTPPRSGNTWQVLEGDCRERLLDLPARSVHTCVTSPPSYFGLRDYGHDGQIGLEPTPDEFCAALVGVFREVRRVLRDDGTVWLNLGDSYARSWGAQSRGGPPSEASTLRGNGHVGGGPKAKGLSAVQIAAHPKDTRTGSIPDSANYKAKDLLGIPWMVAFALRADGWYLRSDIVWAKPNPMPESITDRPTKAHEYVFLLAKSPRYFYDADAIRESFADERQGNPGAYARTTQAAKGANNDRADTGFLNDGNGWNQDGTAAGRNKRSVWTISSQPYAGAHFATFPPALIEPCILAGCPQSACVDCGEPWQALYEGGEGSYATRKALGHDKPQNMVVGEHPGNHRGLHPEGMTHDLTPSAKVRIGSRPACDCKGGVGPGTVLDPFNGAGTTGVVALRHARSYVGIELNPEYADLARERIRDDAPLLNVGAEAA